MAYSSKIQVRIKIKTNQRSERKVKHLKKIILTSCLISTIAFSSDYTEADRKYLTDLPEPTTENLRWAMPADSWEYKDQHLLKGKFFQMSSKNRSANSEKSVDGFLESLNVYTTPSLKGEPLFNIRRKHLNKKNDTLCFSYYTPGINVLGKEIIQCETAYCEPNKDMMSVKSTFHVLDATQKFKFSAGLDCPFQLSYDFKYFAESSGGNSIYDYTAPPSRDKGYIFYFKPTSIDKEGNYIEILVNNKKHYLDTRICKKQPGLCGPVEIMFSDYEKDWINLKKKQEKKDSIILNFLIKELKPCVEKKDLECIKRFFPFPSEDYLSDNYGGYRIPKIELTEDFLAELNACLDYKNLLPHLYGSRGINKVCIFRKHISTILVAPKDKEALRDITLLNVTYPEAVRISISDPIYFIKDK